MRSLLALSLALMLPGFVLAQETPVESSQPEAAAVPTASAATVEPATAATTTETAIDVTSTADANTATQAGTEAESDAEAEGETMDPVVETDSSLIGPPEPGKGQVVFFRPAKFAGGAVGFKVREGDTELGKLRNGKYFVHAADPGTHEYRVHSEVKDLLTLEVEESETYYVQGTITMGFMVGRPNLSPSDEAAFDGMASKLKPAK